MKFKISSTLLAILVPSIALADVSGPCVNKTFVCLVNTVVYPLLNTVMQFIFAATIVFFMWNIFGVIRKADQPEELAKFKSKAVWGIIAIAVMVSMWGLVYFITSSLNLDTTTQGFQVRTGP